MKVLEVRSCSFTSWYEKFKNITHSSIVLPLPADVLNYLLDNGTLVLPDEHCASLPSDEEDEDNDTYKVIAPKLLEFSEKIKASIDTLQGSVFPKLNWSSPKDASWISFNKSLQCFNPSDVYLLLKSSDFITHDLIAPYDSCEDSEAPENSHEYCLVLRKWVEINPSDEFRCYVKNKILVGISQRDISQHYSTIAQAKNDIIFDIIDFWKQKIQDQFNLISYTFDVHRPASGVLALIDFNPFGPPTDSLMFSWYELQRNNDTKYPLEVDSPTEHREENELDSRKSRENLVVSSKNPEFRFVSYDTGVQPNSYMQYGVPADFTRFSGISTPGRLSELLQTKTQKETSESSSDEDANEPESFIASEHH